MAAECQTDNEHNWTEEYYGYRCSRCNLFYAYGCAPWDIDAEGDSE